jgi:isoquinoline 1-oxidoreductase alpha subunit
MTEFQLNGQTVSTDVDPATPLLWVLRDTFELTGTKFGCGISQCGACTIHINGRPMRSCIIPLSRAAGRQVTTIEKVGEDTIGSAVQKAWIEHDVPQCGYCQSGQVMSAVALLKENPSPSDQDIDSFMAGNVCRCGTYLRIKAAIKTAASNIA